MINTWAIMALSFAAPFEGGPFESLPFRSFAECSAAINPTRAFLENQGVEVTGVYCIDTLAPSVSPFPKARPDAVNGGAL